MKSISEFLRDADPLRLESMPSWDQRDYQRKATIAAALIAHDGARSEPRSRITLLVTIVLIMIAISLLAERMWSPRIGDVHAEVRFEVRLAEDKPAPGLREAKISGIQRSVYLHDEAIVTNSDISAARIIQADGSSQCSVSVNFNASGAEKVRAATARHIGKPVAILLDGQVVMALVVRSPIAESAVITGHFSRSEAEKIVNGITNVR